jgi:hypothetical protein
MSKKFEGNPQNLPGSNMTRLALTESEANQYHYGTQYITTVPDDIDSTKLESDHYGRWFVIKGKDLPHPFNPRNRQRLTDNIYGYLTYHDTVVRPSATPHTLFLQWDVNGANINSVTVWIKPPPVISRDPQVLNRDASDPPRPKAPPPPPME